MSKTFEIKAEFHRKQYEEMYRKLTSITTRMELRKAIHRAAQRAAQAGVTESKRIISAETTLKSTEVGKRVEKYVRGSPITDFAIGMKISDTVRPLSDFAFWPKRPKSKTDPVVEIYRGKKQKVSNGAFVQQMPSGHIGIFRRLSEKSLPIREPAGPSVTGIFKANETIHDAVWSKINDTLEKRVLHELHFILDGK